MELGNDTKGKANGNVTLTVEDIDLLLECIWRFRQLPVDSMCAVQYPIDLESAGAIEKQLNFMKKDMQDGTG